MLASPGVTFTATTYGVPPGLVGTLGVKIVDGNGAVVVARTTAGIVEISSESGVYVKDDFVAPVIEGYFVIVWDDGETFASEDLWVTQMFVSTKATTDAIYAAVDTEIGAIKAKTDLIPVGGPLAASAYVPPDNATIASIYAAVDTEIATLQAAINAVKAKTDNLPLDPADASDVAALIGNLDTEIDTLQATVNGVKAKTDALPSDPADASVLASQISGLDTEIDALQSTVNAVKVKTDNLPIDPADASDINALIVTVNNTLGLIKEKTDLIADEPELLSVELG
jgi:hypothetical protein